MLSVTLATNAAYSAGLDIKIASSIWWLIGNIPAVHVGAASLVVCGAKHVRGDIVCARSMIRTALAHGLPPLVGGVVRTNIRCVSSKFPY